MEEVETGQEFNPYLTQVGGRRVHPVKEHLPPRVGEGVDLAGRAPFLGLSLRGYEAGFLELFELGVELAHTDAPDSSQLAAELLVELVAMSWLSHEQPKNHGLGRTGFLTRHAFSLLVMLWIFTT